MSFDEIPIRMMQLGVDRAWLAKECDYSPRTMAAILAPNASPSNKTDKALRRIWEALDREEERRKKPAITDEKCAIVIRAAVDEFEHWNKVSMGKGLTIEQWAMEQLNRAANSLLEVPASAFNLRHEPETARTGIDEVPYKARNAQIIELPLLRAAAGAPILGDAEMVEVDRDYGKGRFLLELRGDSMEPQFHDRQRVILRDKSTLKRPLLKYGEFYAFIVDGLVTFKQWAKDKEGNRVMHSLNPEHPDIPADETTDWIGWFDAKDNA